MKRYKIQVEPQITLEFEAKDLREAKKKAKELKERWIKNKPQVEEVINVELS